MSAVDDVRKLLQDFLAPELRAISVRLDAVEARLTQQDVQRQHDKEALESRLTQQDTQRQRDKEALESLLTQQDTQRQRDKEALESRLTQQDIQRQHDKEDILRAIQTLSDYHSLSERLAQVESKISQAHQ